MKTPIILTMSILAMLAVVAPASGDTIATWIADAPIEAKLRADLTALTPADWAKVDQAALDRQMGNYPPAVQHNLRLWVARQLVHASLYDEADGQLAQIDSRAVVDPASLHFYRAVSAYRAMDKARTLEAVDQLLDFQEANHTVPERYLAVASLMQKDIAGIKEESLDHIARQMEDIGRRLDLGRSGKKVQDIEDAVIQSLDKMIEQIEKQQQQQSGSSGNNTQSTKPANDSNLMGGKGPGSVKRKDIGAKDGWGNLPPKQREEAMQEVGRRFPGALP